MPHSTPDNPVPGDSAESGTTEPGTADPEIRGLDFESAIAELEALVAQMEAGDMTLEASLGAYERGVRLARHCQAALKDAELKIRQLTDDDRLEPLDPDSLDDD